MRRVALFAAVMVGMMSSTAAAQWRHPTAVTLRKFNVPPQRTAPRHEEPTRASYVGDGALVGALVGVVAGAGVGWALAATQCSRSYDSCVAIPPVFYISTATGLAGGTALGAVLGNHSYTVATRPKEEPVPLPSASQPVEKRVAPRDTSAHIHTIGNVVVGGGVYSNDFTTGALATFATGWDLLSSSGLGLSLELGAIAGGSDFAATLGGDLMWQAVRDMSGANVALFLAGGYGTMLVLDGGWLETIRIRAGLDVFRRSRVGFRIDAVQLFVSGTNSTIGPFVRLGVLFR